MSFRYTQQESRKRFLATYDAEEAAKCESWLAAMTPATYDALLADMKQCVEFDGDLDVLDVGSGVGALCLALARIPGLRITALEPCATMIEQLKLKPQLSEVSIVEGFCDHSDDQLLFDERSFDLIASRQLVNCLYDPLTAFRNWYAWLRPGGSVVVMDGLFDRQDWPGQWDGIVDTLPLSACRTMATVPYLLESTGFHIDYVGLMEHTNALSTAPTQRYIVSATKPGR